MSDSTWEEAHSDVRNVGSVLPMLLGGDGVGLHLP